jgi:hypothetical protein
MKVKLLLAALLMLSTATAVAESVTFRFEGQLNMTIGADIGCSIVVPSPWQGCVTVQADAPDMMPGDPATGLYDADYVEAVLGNCRLGSSDFGSYGWILVNNDWGGTQDWFEAALRFDPYAHGDISTLRVGQLFSDTSMSMFTSDAIPVLAETFDAADSKRIYVYAYNSDGSLIGKVHGSLDTYANDDLPCGVDTLLSNLIAQVIVLDLPTGLENNLVGKLQAALDALIEPKAPTFKPAIRMIEVFIDKVEAQSGNKIAEEDAAYLIEAAEAILAMLL